MMEMEIDQAASSHRYLVKDSEIGEPSVGASQMCRDIYIRKMMQVLKQLNEIYKLYKLLLLLLMMMIKLTPFLFLKICLLLLPPPPSPPLLFLLPYHQ